MQPSEKEAFRNGRAQEIQKLNEELAASQEKLQAALVAAEKASRAKTTFLSNMSHDIRTPMNAIVGLTTLLEHEIHEPEKLQLHIQKIQNSSQHLLGLINDILDFSDFENDNITFNIRTHDAVKLCNEVVETVMASRKLEVEMRFDTDLSVLMLDTDDARLRQVLNKPAGECRQVYGTRLHRAGTEDG